MLTNNDHKRAGYALGGSLGRLKLDVRPGTPLERVMHESISPTGEDITGISNGVGNNTHDIVIAQAVEQGVKYLHASMHRARAVVLPMVNDLTDQLNAAVTERVSSITEFSIKPIKHLKILDVASFVALAEQTGNWEDTLKTPLPSSMFPKVDYDTQMDDLVIGINTIDEAADEFKVNVETIKYVHAALANNPVANIDTYVNQMGPHFAPIALYLVKALQVNEEKLDYNTDETIRLYLRALEIWLSSRVTRVVARREQAYERGNVILSHYGKNIEVNSDTYNAYLKAGGSPEGVMGAVILGRSVPLNRTILEQGQTEFLDAYDAYVTKMKAQVVSMRAEAYRTLLPAMLFDYMKDLESNELPLDVLQVKIREAMAKVAIKASDIYPAVRQLVCEVLYPKADTLVVLSRIDDLMEENPDMDAADAATACYVSLLTDYYYSQLTVEKV